MEAKGSSESSGPPLTAIDWFLWGQLTHNNHNARNNGAPSFAASSGGATCYGEEEEEEKEASLMNGLLGNDHKEE